MDKALQQKVVLSVDSEVVAMQHAGEIAKALTAPDSGWEPTATRVTSEQLQDLAFYLAYNPHASMLLAEMVGFHTRFLMQQLVERPDGSFEHDGCVIESVVSNQAAARAWVFAHTPGIPH